MKELGEFMSSIALLVGAIAAAIAAFEARQANRKAKRIERELDVNPQKSADAVVKALNGTLPTPQEGEPGASPR
jgi:hypothetical protein